MSHYSDWERQFDGQIQVRLKINEKVLHESCDIFFKQLVNNTPVGNPALWHPPYFPHNYVPGSLKKAWEIEHKSNYVVIQNPMPYALRIESGWSSQAPAGMMRVGLKDFHNIVNKVINKYK